MDGNAELRAGAHRLSLGIGDLHGEIRGPDHRRGAGNDAGAAVQGQPVGKLPAVMLQV